MNNRLISLSFWIIGIQLGIAQGNINDSLNNQGEFEEIAVIEKYDSYYLKKGNGYEIQGTFRYSYGPKKRIFKRYLKDVPELCSLASDNLNAYRTMYGLGLIHCYNDYVSTGRVKELNQDYYDQFGLIPIREYRNGPTEARLAEPKKIVGVVNHVTTVTENYTNHMKTSSTVGDYHRLQFYYGDFFYKGGFALKNLKRAIGQDEEANEYIKQYRRKYFGRATILSVGIAQAGLALAWGFTGNAPFGLSTPVGIAVLAPGVIFLNWMNLFPQNYKTRLINQTIDTYNRNLGF